MSSTKTSTAALGSVRRWLGSDSRGIPGHLSGATSMDWVCSKEGLRGCESEGFLTSFGMTDVMAGRRFCLQVAMNSRVPGPKRGRFERFCRDAACRVPLDAVDTRRNGDEPGCGTGQAASRGVYVCSGTGACGRFVAVNLGHDAWCRDPQLVSAASLRRSAREFEEVEAASLPLELQHRQEHKAVYTLHSLGW